MDAGDRSVDMADQPCPIGLYIQRKEANVNRQVNQVANKKVSDNGQSYEGNKARWFYCTSGVILHQWMAWEYLTEEVTLELRSE